MTSGALHTAGAQWIAQCFDSTVPITTTPECLPGHAKRGARPFASCLFPDGEQREHSMTHPPVAASSRRWYLTWNQWSDVTTLIRCYQEAEDDTMLPVMNEPRKVMKRAKTG
jgi:hypothetical protein